MAGVINKDTDTAVGGVNVLGGDTGASTTPEAPAADAGVNTGSSAIQSSGQSVNQAQSKGASSSKKAPASSGMFTNIQNYVNKNQPQAQKMAKASTQDFSKQAADIRKATEDKQTQQKERIQTIKTVFFILKIKRIQQAWNINIRNALSLFTDILCALLSAAMEHKYKNCISTYYTHPFYLLTLRSVYLKGDFPAEFKRLQIETESLLEELKTINNNPFHYLCSPKNIYL
jgi:hypothetical protein